MTTEGDRMNLIELDLPKRSSPAREEMRRIAAAPLAPTVRQAIPIPTIAPVAVAGYCGFSIAASKIAESIDGITQRFELIFDELRFEASRDNTSGASR